MFEIKMPKLGESIEQATIIRWFVNEGDTVVEDDVLLEIATDKVDSEIPSPVAGVVHKILFPQDALVAVGQTIALISTDSAEGDQGIPSPNEQPIVEEAANALQPLLANGASGYKPIGRFYSPLVRSIAKAEGVPMSELDSIAGSGLGGRVTKDDILGYVSRRSKPLAREQIREEVQTLKVEPKISLSIGAEDTIVQMDRTRKLIAEHMVASRNTSVHVTSMLEADVTELVRWRERCKGIFEEKYRLKLTYMPMFTQAAARALRDYPAVNASVDGERIILRGRVNIGIAVARPDGNLVVPVVRNADKLNLAGLAESISSLAQAARDNRLQPDDIQGGTFSITNFGSFRNLMGTPIIAQPQVAILATGSIEKKPAVMETPYGDVIVPRHKMFLSLSYDHRIIDGALGGAFLRQVADYLEKFDPNSEV